MAEKDKKYYWLKLKKDFFKRHDIQIIESMENGKDYILFYLKLLCESVDHEGNLRFSKEIPYNDKMLATITNTNIDVVRNAVNVFTSLNMMTLLDDETLYMNKIEDMIGSETYWAQKKREKRSKLNNVGNFPTLSNEIPTLSNEIPTCPSKSIDKDIELDKEIEKDNNICSPSSERDIVTQQVEEIWLLYPNKKGKATAIKKIPKLIKEHGYEKIKQCVERYALECKGKDKQYIKHGSTFFNGGYMDYLDENIAEANENEYVVGEMRML